MSIIIMLLLLSVLILVHELGHFLAARFFKIKVEKFGFGLPIGPVLYQTQWGDVKILVHAFLLGGYVAFPDDESDCALDKDSSERFSNKPIYQRAVVVSAGVVANVLCAFAFVFLTAALWGHLPSGKFDIFINNITAPKTESVWQSGLQKKDQIVEINGAKIDTTSALISFVRLSKANDGKVAQSFMVENYQALKDLNPIFTKDEIIPKDVAVKLPEKKSEPLIKLDDKILKGMKKYKDSQLVLSAHQKKMRDLIADKSYFVSDGKTTLNDLAFALSDNVHPVYFKVKRENHIVELKPIYVNKNGQIGIRLEAKELYTQTKTPKQIFVAGSKYLYDNTYMLLYGLYQIFTGQIHIQDLHGIVAITKVGGDIIQNSGIFSGLLLIAIISMDLAIVNILPIPALDGGHLLFLILEKINGKPLNQEVIEKIANICFYFLLALMFMVIFNDVWGLITHKF